MELSRQPLPGRWRSRNFQSLSEIRPRSASEKMFVSRIGIGRKIASCYTLRKVAEQAQAPHSPVDLRVRGHGFHPALAP
jgi:hypothetical protein